MKEGAQNLPEGSFWRSAWGNLRNALIGCSAAVIFGLVVLLMSILAVGGPKAASLNGDDVVVNQEATVKVEYYLPYPGILPDSPMYKLKMVRDRVSLWLSGGGEARIRRELLYADKRIGAAKTLVDGGKVSLGVSTATKAEKYLAKAVDRVVNLNKEGKDVKSMLATLTNATSKHAEILEGMRAKTSGSDRDGVEAAGKLAKMTQEQLRQATIESK